MVPHWDWNYGKEANQWRFNNCSKGGIFHLCENAIKFSYLWHILWPGIVIATTLLLLVDGVVAIRVTASKKFPNVRSSRGGYWKRDGMRNCVVALNVTCPRRPASLRVVTVGGREGRMRDLGKENRSNRCLVSPVPSRLSAPFPALPLCQLYRE